MSNKSKVRQEIDEVLEGTNFAVDVIYNDKRKTFRRYKVMLYRKFDFTVTPLHIEALRQRIQSVVNEKVERYGSIAAFIWRKPL